MKAADDVVPKPEQEAVDSWVKALSESRFDDSLTLLESQLNGAEPQSRVLLESIIGHVKMEKDPAIGVPYFENLVRQHPTKPEPYTWWALSYSLRELPDKTLAVLDRGLSQVDAKAKLFEAKAGHLQTFGRLDEALEVARQGVDADPSFVDNYLVAADLLAAKGDNDGARSWYLKALDVSLGEPNVADKYALFLLNTDKYHEAILRYQDLVNRNPKDPKYYALLGNAYLAAEFPGRALRAYRKANELAEGKVAWILANIGNLMNNRGFYSEAVEYLQKALELDPTLKYAHERLASAQQAEADEAKRVGTVLAEVRSTLNKSEQPPAPAP
ncbi:MAG: tetratricopeptide repeat protein [Acidobacteriota bacterium]